MNPIFTIRHAAQSDIGLIQALAAEAFTATYRAILSPEQLDYMLERMYSAATLRRELESGFGWFVAACDGEPCGYLSIEKEGESVFHLQKIYLLPRFQGRGGGVFLFGAAVEYIRSIHPTPCRMELNVNRSNRALHFYERMGMYKAREGDFPIGNGYYMNDYIMALDIE